MFRSTFLALSRNIRNYSGQLLANACMLCQQSNPDIVCSGCRHRYLRDQAERRCYRCALSLPGLSEVDLCANCIKSAPAFEHTICAFDYIAPQDQLLLDLKFAAKLALANEFATLLAQAIEMQENPILPELVTAMPLGPERLAQRGYNQAAEIARRLATKLGLAYQAELLWRTKETQAQASLDFRARQKNVKAAFSPKLDNLHKIKGRHIAVVDDVMTTGASLNEIATMLKLHGATRVTAYVVARTPLSTATF